MSTHEMRARWEQEKRLALLLAILIGGIALVGWVLLARRWQLSVESALSAIVLGALGWQLLLWAIEAIGERLKHSDPSQNNPPLRMIGLGLPLLLSLWGFAQIPGVIPPLVLGGFGLSLLWAARRTRELHRPRSFLEITNDGGSLAVPKGTLLLEALERAGYRLMTQCGRKGGCSTCRVRVHQASQRLAEEHYGPVMTPKQRRENWVLSCQVRVEGDLILELAKPLVVRWPRKMRLSEKARRIRRVLPGFDCEACGYFTCDEYAQALTDGQAPPTECLPGGAWVRQRLQG